MDGVKFGKGTFGWPKLYAAGVAALVVLAAASCSTPAILVAPPTGPGTEYPCGVNGIVCANSMCCWRGDACGGTTGCPAGSCCYVGGDDGLTGAHPPRPQWRAGETRAAATP